MTYKNWILKTKKEWNGIVVDYVDPEGNIYNEPFCFQTFEEAENYGKICIDQILRSMTLMKPPAQSIALSPKSE